MSNQGRESGQPRTSKRTRPVPRASNGRTTVIKKPAGSGRHTGASDRNRANTSSVSRQMHVGGAISDGNGPIRRPHHHMKGRSLRTTLMLSMVGMTAVTMIVLGLILTTLSSSFLIGQAQHKGVELAKMAAQVGRSVLDNEVGGGAFGQRNQSASQLQREREERIQKYFSQATTWGDQADTYSDIIGITYYQGELSGLTWGDPIQTATTGERLSSISLPRLGWVRLPDDIVVSQTSRNNLPVYRFRVQLNNPKDSSYLRSEVWLDLAADKVVSVRNRLFIIVGISVVVSMAIVLFLAIYIAGRITTPVHKLMRDMNIVAKGDLDHQTRAHSKDEIGILANSFNIMTRELKGAQSALVEQEKAQYELSIAQEVQQQLLPAEAPEIANYEPFAYYKGAKAVSGDYYDFIPLGNDLWGFIIADVSGKGIPGSMVMAITRTIIRLVANRHQNKASETLKETNRLIAKQIKRGMFVTAFYAVLNTRTGQLSFSSAGHNPMLIYRAASKTYELAAPKGIAIGFNYGPIFDKNIQEFQSTLNPGDSILLYTDGFPEAMNEQEEEYGDDEFYELVGKTGHLGAQGLIEAMVEEIAQHRGKAAQSDDLTAVAVTRRA